MRTRIAGLLLTSALLAAACVEGTDPESPEAAEEQGETEIVWAIADVDAHGPIADLWNEQNPDTPVRIEELPEDADGQRQQITLELDAEGDAFDVLALDVIWTGEFALNGWIENVDDLRGDLEGEIVETALSSAVWNDTLWGVPYNTNAAFLYYRTDLVDEPPTTWEELVEVGNQAAEEEGIYPYVSQGAQYEGLVTNYLELVWAAGGDLYSEDFREVVFGQDDSALWAADFMRTAMENGFFAAGFNTMQEEDARIEFQQGGAVFMRNWPYAYGLLSGEVDEDPSEVADVFDIAPLPTGESGEPVTALGGFNNAVSAHSSNKELAKEFVLWAGTDPEVQQTLAENAMAPTLQSVYEDMGDDPVIGLLAEILPHGRPRPPVPEYSEVSVEIQQQIFPAYNGDAEPADAVDAIRTFMEERLAERDDAAEAAEEEQEAAE